MCVFTHTLCIHSLIIIISNLNLQEPKTISEKPLIAKKKTKKKTVIN